MDYLTGLLSDPTAWVALLTLIVMEVVLGIDNLIFISILTNKLPEHQRARARRIGISAALVMRLILLGTIAFIVRLTEMRPFEIGDQIVIGQTEGSVERINLRATQIRTYDGRAVLVPNAELFTSRLTNNTESPVRRGVVQVPLGYQADLKDAVEVIRAATQKADGVLEEPLTSVRVRELKQDDIILEASFWTDSRRSDFVATSSNVRTAIVEAMRAASIGLPDPSARAVTVKGWSPASDAVPDATR